MSVLVASRRASMSVLVACRRALISVLVARLPLSRVTCSFASTSACSSVNPWSVRFLIKRWVSKAMASLMAVTVRHLLTECNTGSMLHGSEKR